MSVSLQSPPSSAISSSLHFHGRKLSLLPSNLVFSSRPSSLPVLRASALDTGSATELDAVSSFSEIVPDTVIFDDFERFPPTAATVSSALLLGICSLPDTIFRNAVDMALADSECNKHENSELRLSCFFNKALVNVGADLAKLVPGRVSTEVDARLAYDTHGIIRKVHDLLKLYDRVDVPPEKLLFKIPSTWQGIEASRLLESEGIQTHLTFVYSFAQAAAAAQAGASVIQIFVGRLRDWSRNHSGDPEIEAALKRGEDPGLALLKTNHAAPVLTDPAPTISKSRLGIHSSLLPYSQQGAPFSVKYITIPRKKPGKIDDVRSNGWLDAMKSSSPPRKKLNKDFSVEFASDDTDNAYLSWMLKHPSALNFFERITKFARNKKIAVFLDYDGTLSPIVDDPDRAFISDAMRDAVRNVAKYFPTAIISGRNRDMVYELVGLTELYYAGSHGMDIMGPVTNTNSGNSTDKQGKEVKLFQPATEFLPMIDEVFRVLVEKTKGIKGAKVENHKFCASVHYRNVDEKNWSTIGQRVHDVLKHYPRLRLTHGRRVLEVRPEIDWNKGKAVEFLLESLGLNSMDDVLSIYIGDDRTDEDAFKVLRKGNHGYGILVSPTPKETSAFYSLREPAEVMEFLKALVSWKEQEGAN